MTNNNISIQERTENFSVRVIKAYCQLNKRNFDDAGKVLSKQFLRSGTSIGANCAEAVYAQSNNDFIWQIFYCSKRGFTKPNTGLK